MPGGLAPHTLKEPEVPDSTHIPTEIANHVLFHFGQGGYQPGSFTTHLLCAFAASDEENFFRLAAAYPEYGAAVAAIQYDPDGVQQLQQIAAGQVVA